MGDLSLDSLHGFAEGTESIYTQVSSFLLFVQFKLNILPQSALVLQVLSLLVMTDQLHC